MSLNALVRASSLLSGQGNMAEDPGVVGDGLAEQEAMVTPSSESLDVDESVYINESVRLGPFQTQILEYRVKPLIGESAHIMVTPLRWQPGEVQPLPPRLHVLHKYTRLKMSSNKVSIILRNMSESQVLLKKGVQVARVVSASLVELWSFTHGSSSGN